MNLIQVLFWGAAALVALCIAGVGYELWRERR